MDQLFTEITQQPAAAEKLIQEEFTNIRTIIKKIKSDFHYIVIAARGSSDNAGRYAQYLFGSMNRIPVALTTPSLFTLYGTPPNLEGALVISISQSGMSPDIVETVKNANSQGCTTICITNKADSPLALESEYTIPIHAGAEKAVAATKSYTNSLIALAMLCGAFSGDQEFTDLIKKIPQWLQTTIDSAQKEINKIQRYRYIESCAVLSRGLNYCTAFEIALKVKELTGINANPYSSADFKHGPIATVYNGFPVFVIAPHGQVFSDMKQMVQELVERRAEVISVSNDEGILQASNLGFRIPDDLPESLSPIASTIPGQFFGRQIAIERGLNPDSPEGLHKVTETF